MNNKKSTKKPEKKSSQSATKKKTTARKTSANGKKNVAKKTTTKPKLSTKKSSAASKKTSTKSRSTTAKKSTTKYGPKAQKAVEKEMHAFKRGQAHSGKSKKPVKSRKQAIAIGLSKARKQGAKVPRKKAA